MTKLIARTSDRKIDGKGAGAIDITGETFEVLVDERKKIEYMEATVIARLADLCVLPWHLRKVMGVLASTLQLVHSIFL